MFNPRLTETLTDFPFARLNALIAPITPPAHLSMINMSVGEPRERCRLRPADRDRRSRWLEPLSAEPGPARPQPRDLRVLTRRYKLPQGLLDPNLHVHPTAGSKEGVYIISTVATPQEKGGGKPIVALPNPFYQAYLGGAVLSGGEPLLVNAEASNGFLPDYESLDEATWRRMSVVYLCSPANPQGAIASKDYLQKLLKLCRKYDTVLAVDECYAEIYTGAPPPGALEAALEIDERPAARIRSTISRCSIRCRSARTRRACARASWPAIRSWSRWCCAGAAMAGRRSLRRTEGVGRVVARGDASGQTREWYVKNFRIAEQILHNRFSYYTPGGGFFLWLDVGDGEEATRKLWGEAHVKVLPGAYACRETDGINISQRYIPRGAGA